jgi:hypothetical protein
MYLVAYVAPALTHHIFHPTRGCTDVVRELPRIQSTRANRLLQVAEALMVTVVASRHGWKTCCNNLATTAFGATKQPLLSVSLPIAACQARVPL